MNDNEQTFTLDQVNTLKIRIFDLAEHNQQLQAALKNSNDKLSSFAAGVIDALGLERTEHADLGELVKEIVNLKNSNKVSVEK